MTSPESSHHPIALPRTRLASLCAVVNTAAIMLVLVLPTVASLLSGIPQHYTGSPRLILVALAFTLWNTACLGLWVGKGSSRNLIGHVFFWMAMVDAFFFPTLLLLYLLAPIFLGSGLRP
jgi:hypothetical protein